MELGQHSNYLTLGFPSHLYLMNAEGSFLPAVGQVGQKKTYLHSQRNQRQFLNTASIYLPILLCSVISFVAGQRHLRWFKTSLQQASQPEMDDMRSQNFQFSKSIREIKSFVMLRVSWKV